MKRQVITQEPEQKLLTLQHVNDDLYYGIVRGEEFKLTGFLTRSQYNNSAHILAFSTDELTKGNNWSSIQNHTNLRLAIENLILIGFTVYAFDTAKELFQWLADNTQN